jgi:hypothetical protein
LDNTCLFLILQIPAKLIEGFNNKLVSPTYICMKNR